ncbi:DNA primase [Streptomyces olivaceus]|uniref:DNA primase n=1 Tax=Streptomyces olivaceus TaxID=47716 RepID=UPI001CCC6645|nr:DNA primase [Streptomyces olivaceus]MBZ6196320.1 DNA primase [Streptomyces olivaceus]MBZ6309613.1 DNA primase [Streptomyces olivaceus]MBZ6323412.1 DNA primase [Streptomyces olivaceus]
MNRVGMGLAVGAGYLLGRTKKLKLAVAVGTMVAGKKLNLTPKGIAELVSGQLQNNPQFKEIGDQLRTDLRGVGKAASGAMVERQIGALADRLHGRTAEVRDQLSGAVPKAPGVGSRDSGDSEDPEEYAEQDDERDERDERDGRDADDEPDGRAGRERDGRRPAGKTAPAARKAAKKAPAKKAPARKTAAKAPAKKAAVKRAQPAKKATGKKTAGARSAARGAGTRQSKGGGER